jgi:lipoate-protein ligase A
MKYRFIPLHTFSGAMNMALDEAIMKRVRNKECLPTLRMYKWSPACVSIGYFQGLKQEIAEEVCEEKGVDIVRRQTGGGAVYHDAEITYSLIAPESYFAKDIKKSYAEICSYIVNALHGMGIMAEFSPINDVLVNHQKISGNAQTRKDGILLQHGTILCKVDVDTMFSLLKVGKEKISDKLVASVKKAVTSLELQGRSEEEFIQAFEKSFSQDNQLVTSTYTEGELADAQVIAKEKYGNMNWIGMR